MLTDVSPFLQFAACLYLIQFGDYIHDIPAIPLDKLAQVKKQWKQIKNIPSFFQQKTSICGNWNCLWKGGSFNKSLNLKNSFIKADITEVTCFDIFQMGKKKSFLNWKYLFYSNSGQGFLSHLT